ncbi:MAG: ABC transporter substrate-binding protein [Pyrinomonadaceae bacterium]
MRKATTTRAPLFEILRQKSSSRRRDAAALGRPIVSSPPLKQGEQSSQVAYKLDTAFHSFIAGPARLVVPSDPTRREKAISKEPALSELLSSGREFVPIRAEDVGIEAVDDYTLRITLTQPAPFFISLMAHQFFRAVPQRTIERYGARWTQPENIVTSGAFLLKSWKPYDQIVVEKNPFYWDAANVRLNKIYFYPLEETATILNLYKAGDVDATFNHTVPPGWIDSLRPLQDYMDAPESTITYIMVNTAKYPLDDVARA